MATSNSTLNQGVQNYFKPVASGSGWSMSDNAAYTDPGTGLTYTKVGGGDTGQPLQIIEFDPRTQKPGDTLKVYNPDGTFSHTFQSSKDEGTKLALMFLAAAGGMAALPGGAFSGSFGQGTMAAQNGMELGGAAGGGVGGPNFAQGFTDGGTSGGALDTAYAGTGANGYGPNFSQGYTDGGTSGGALDTGYATGSASTPYTTSGGVLPNGTGGAITKVAGSMIPAGVTSLLGPAATIAGAIAGGQGTPGQTTEKRMDPRLDQYVYGDLMPKVQGLLNSQMPMAQQAGQQMRQIGGGLLSAPIAGNGFNMFTKGRY